MYRTRILALALSLIVLGAVAASAATDRVVEAEGREAASIERTATPQRVPTGGPIRSTDPVVRAEIERLYAERDARVADRLEQMDELNEQIAAASSKLASLELRRELAELKQSIERENIVSGLQIANLDGDTTRAADFAAALDRLDHPEKYLPAPVDPSVREQRMQALSGQGEVVR